METFFMNTKNSKTKEPYRFKYDLNFILFFLSGFSFTTIHKSQDCRGRGRAFL